MYMKNPGHMTKMVDMPIYAKILPNFSSQELVDGLQRNLACSIDD